jgi:hypothetical protein
MLITTPAGRPGQRNGPLSMDDFRALSADLARIFIDDDRPDQERQRLLILMEMFAALPPPEDPLGLCRNFSELQRHFREAVETAQPDVVEEAFLNLYCGVHGHEAPYTDAERKRMDQLGGYWCHAGGLAPILRAGEHIGPDTVSADFGAGNGLQGLLLQKLYPHARTIQIEISSRMVAWGKMLQKWLGIDEDRVTWIVGDVLDHSPQGIDFIYLYRPVRPEGQGRRFYEQFAAALADSPDKVVIFSIADCLKPFLAGDFEVFYSDGHLTCFRNR